MNKLFLLAAPVLAVALATPAAAQPSGVRVEGIVGYDEVRIDFDGTGPGTRDEVHGVTYGAGVGFDFAMGPGVAIGADAEFTETTADFEPPASSFSAGRDIYVGGRLTAAVSNSFSIYGKLGYSNFRIRTTPDNTALAAVRRNLDGVRGAIGVQFGDEEESRAYYGFELRLSDYDSGISRRQAALVIGARF